MRWKLFEQICISGEGLNEFRTNYLQNAEYQNPPRKGKASSTFILQCMQFAVRENFPRSKTINFSTYPADNQSRCIVQKREKLFISTKSRKMKLKAILKVVQNMLLKTRQGKWILWLDQQHVNQLCIRCRRFQINIVLNVVQRSEIPIWFANFAEPSDTLDKFCIESRWKWSIYMKPGFSSNFVDV